MKRLSFVALVAVFIMFFISGNMFSQEKFSYQKSWQDVEKFIEQDKPRSALSVVDKILQQARKEGNVVQTIKARASYLQISYAFSPDSLTSIIQRVEAEVATSKNDLERMLSSAMLADWYWQYYRESRWYINDRGNLADETPKDIKEWTKRQFIEKIFSLLNSSISNTELLQSRPAKEFKEILQSDVNNKDGLEVQQTLYELMLWNKIETLYKLIDNRDYLMQRDITFEVPINLTDISSEAISSVILNDYAYLIGFCIKLGNLQGAVYAELSLAKRSTSNDSERLERLDELERKYAGKDVLVEIWSEQIETLTNLRARGANSQAIRNSNNLKAYNIALKGIAQFPNYTRIDLLKKAKDELEKRSIVTNVSDFVSPNSTLKFSVDTKNIKTLKISIYKVEESALTFYEKARDYRSARKRSIKTSAKPIFETEKSVEYENLIDLTTTTVEVPTADYGIYKLVVGSPKDANGKCINVEATFVTTDFALIERAATSKYDLPKNYKICEFYVVNRITGEPYRDVTTKFYKGKWENNSYKFIFQKSIKGAEDFKYVSNNDRTFVLLERGGDKYFATDIGDNYFWQPDERKAEVSVSLFTDRSLYRPSQTVKFKGIAYVADKSIESVVPNHTMEVFLRNVNYEKIDTLTLTTNEFGSFSGEFTLPAKGLNGNYMIYTESGSQGFRVEEYKRPTFMAEIQKSADEIKFGEEVKLKGSAIAYAGYAMQGAKVKYRVSRRVYSIYRWFLYTEPVTILTGETTTDSKGKFEVAFTPEKSDLDQVRLYNSDGLYYRYQIEADVTDEKGETQQCRQSIYVSEKPLYLKVNVGNKVNSTEPLKIKVSAENVNGIKKSVSCDYALIDLETDAYYEDLQRSSYLFDPIPNSKSEFSEKKTVRSGKFSTENSEFTLDIKNLKSGFYLLRFSAKDSWGGDVVSEKRILISSPNDKKPPVKTYLWSSIDNDEVKVGEKAKVRFGTTEKNAYALYEVLLGNKIIESHWVQLSDEIKEFEVEMKEAYEAGVAVQITMVRNERFFREKFEIKRKPEDKSLKPKLTVFRDKLLPGEEAEWTVQVPNPTKTPKKVELLLEMYDYSLEAISPHNWSFSPNYVPRMRDIPSWGANISPTSGVSEYDRYSTKYPVPFILYQFKFGYIERYRYMVGANKRGTVMYTEASIVEDAKVADYDMAVSGDNTILEATEVEVAMGTKKGKGYVGSAEYTVGDEVEEAEKAPEIKARENFDETAFFYPHIVADDNGEAKFSFKMPESLTKWRLQILAHTQDLYTGKAEMFVITQQELMIQMNLPRFIRRSDRLKLAATVTNMTDQPITPKAMLEVIDPKSDEVVLRIPANVAEIEANSTQSVSWDLPELKEYELLIFKAVAYTEQFQDGEQRYLPILPDKVLITEAMPIRAGRGGAEKTFRFDSFIRKNSQVETLRYKVEYSSNPAWYAVQALAPMSEPSGENAIAYLSAYYANSLGNFITKSHPKIKTNIDKWIAEDTTELMSQLQKNPELQNVPIAETPWAKEAQDEAFQKQQLAKLLDDVYSKTTADEMLKKLLALQTPSGGFAWFSGMRDSWYITSVVVENLWKLSQLTGSNLKAQNGLSESVRKACKYLDDEFVKGFEWLKKNNKNYQKIKNVSSSTLRYLYLRANLTEFPRDRRTAEAWAFYTERVYKHWTNFGLYDRAMAISLATREGKKSVAKSIAESLKEHSQQTDEMGMYWERNTAGYFWQERPIVVQTALIEAFREVYGDCPEVEEMKIWLLKQKQTQRWDSPISTANAVYVLLSYGKELINEEPNVQIYVGEKLIDNTRQTAGTGYFSEELDREKLTPEMGTIRVKSSQKSGTSWGAVYWQFFEEMSLTEQGKGELSITKELYVEQMVKGKRTLVPISKVKLKKGDKVVSRMVVRTSRDLEFVSIRDLRAACFEPVEQLSRMVYREGEGYYQSSKDSSTEFFFDNMPKGTYVFEYDMWVNNSGIYSSGMAEIQCQYAPEFTSHSRGERVEVE